ISSISRIEEGRYLWLDRYSVRNLELIGSANENAKTLVDVLDQTSSPMGARLLRRWIVMPLKELKPINDRLGVVEYLIGEEEFREEMQHHIRQIGDLERLISKIGLQKANPREVCQLKKALTAIDAIKKLCEQSGSSSLKAIGEQLNPCTLICEKIARELNPEPPVMLIKGSVMNDGVNEELDRLRKIAFGGKGYLLEIQKREAEQTGIPSLKVSFNNVFGYYLEVTHSHRDKVPTEWIRKQTLVNAERYITPELKEYEEQILGAEEKILSLEMMLYQQLLLAIEPSIASIQVNAHITAQLDCLLCFANNARQYNY